MSIIETKPCPISGCGGTAELIRYCGAWVCQTCDHHLGLVRCYCGWAASGGDGRRELEEMGEEIEAEPEVGEGPPYDSATATGMYDHDDYN